MSKKIGSVSYQGRSQLGSERTTNNNFVTWVQEGGVHTVSTDDWKQVRVWYKGTDYKMAQSAFKTAKSIG